MSDERPQPLSVTDAVALAKGAVSAWPTLVVNGEVVERLSLAGEPRDITVRAGGGFNVVRVGEGRAAVVSADCPDQTCVKNGEISRPGEGSVCLPHKLVVRVTGGRGGEVDAVSR